MSPLEALMRPPDNPATPKESWNQGVRNVLASLLNTFAAPGRAGQGQYGVQPTTPGLWSEEDEFRRQQAQGRQVSDAVGLGGLMVGSPMTPQGALGSSSQLAPGMVRLYHGGREYAGGPRWVTTNRKYAETGYVTPGVKEPRKNASYLHYVDVPSDSPWVKQQPGGGTLSFHAPEELARQLQPFYPEIPK